MNSLPSSVERENLGQFLLENLQNITDKLDQIVTDSDRRVYCQFTYRLPQINQYFLPYESIL